jgi:predicted nucleic acid-binding protein
VLLVDTGVFLAAADGREESHDACAGVLRAHRRDLTVAVPVIAESAWLIERRLGTATLNHRDFRAVRPNHVEPFELMP